MNNTIKILVNKILLTFLAYKNSVARVKHSMKNCIINIITIINIVTIVIVFAAFYYYIIILILLSISIINLEYHQ